MAFLAVFMGPTWAPSSTLAMKEGRKEGRQMKSEDGMQYIMHHLILYPLDYKFELVTICSTLSKNSISCYLYYKFKLV